VRPLARAAAAALATRACDTSSFSCPERNAVLTSCWRLGIGVGVGTMIGRERAGTSQPATSSSQQDPVRPPMFHWGFAHSTVPSGSYSYSCRSTVLYQIDRTQCRTQC
jgi:hypothetical protein